MTALADLGLSWLACLVLISIGAVFGLIVGAILAAGADKPAGRDPYREPWQ